MAEGLDMEKSKLRTILKVIAKSAKFILKLDSAFILIFLMPLFMKIVLAVFLGETSNQVHSGKIGQAIEPIFNYFKNLDLIIHFKICITFLVVYLLSSWLVSLLDLKVKKPTRDLDL